VKQIGGVHGELMDVCKEDQGLAIRLVLLAYR